MLIALLGLPLAGALLLAAVPRLDGRAAIWTGVAASGATFAVALALLGVFDYRDHRPQQVVDVTWIAAIGARFHLGLDGISLPLVALTALLAFLCTIYSLRSLPAAGRPRALMALLLLLEVGMLGTFTALDLLLFFVAFEVVLVPMYFVIAVWGGAHRQYAATKFVLYTLLGSALLIVAILAIYVHGAGTSCLREPCPSERTFDMTRLAAAHGLGMSRGFQDIAFLGLAVAFAIKAPLWPLHTWLPDAHTEAPTVGSVLLAGVLLKMGTYGFIRVALPELPLGARDVAPYLGVLAGIAIIYGSLVCLAQRDLKRLIAYSSVGHMGFVLLGIATLSPLGVDAALFGNIAHGLITGLLFFLVGSLKDRWGTVDMAAIGGGVMAKARLLGALITVAAIASLGLPGLAGFWGEMLAMLGAYRPAAGLPRGLFLALMVLGGIGTVLTAAYLLAMLRRVTLGVVRAPWRELAMPDAAGVELAAWAPLLVLIVGLGLYPRILLTITDGAVRALLGGGS